MSLKAIHVPRIQTFDILRGFFLIVILLNHLFYYPSGLDVLTGRGLLYVSSAEGFFLLSGIVLGLVRGRKLLEKPLRIASTLLLKRSLQLYITSIVLVLLFTFIGWQFMGWEGLKSGIAPPGTPLMEVIWNTLTLQYLYGWADFLRMYAIFLALTPIALWLLRRQAWWVVLMISIAVWTLFPSDYSWSEGFMLMPISWQLVFFSGIVIGFHWPEITASWRRLRPQLRSMLGISLVVMTILTAVASALLVFGERIDTSFGAALESWHKAHELQYFDKSRLPIARLALGAMWFWGLFWLIRRYEAVLTRTIGTFLIPLGVNSLYVYTVQAFIVFFMHLFILPPQILEPSHTQWLLNLLLSVFAILLTWWLVKKRVLFSIIPR